MLMLVLPNTYHLIIIVFGTSNINLTIPITHKMFVLKCCIPVRTKLCTQLNINLSLFGSKFSSAKFIKSLNLSDVHIIV